MRRWNGWGETDTSYPLPDSAVDYLVRSLGEGRPTPDASLQETLAAVSASRLQAHPLVDTDREGRLRHARGQSLPDWIALRSGRLGAFPDGVAYPQDEGQVRELFQYARRSGVHLIPYGGGTSVVGHVNPGRGQRPTLTLDMGAMQRLLDLDEASGLATFQAGVKGPHLEAQLGAHGYTLGHYPQSWEFSTLGGWVATRSSGQQFYRYGRIEQLFAGGHVETPLGALDLPPFPASAAGPDLRHVVLGSEGRLGLLTRAVVRVRPLPERERFLAAFFHDFDGGAEAVRALAQAEVPLSMLRLSDALETETTLALSGRDRLVALADRGLRLLRYGPGRCLLIYALTGDRETCSRAASRSGAVIREAGGLPLGGFVGEQWQKTRFLTPYLRNTLWERGYATDTLETALPWSRLLAAGEAMLGALRKGLRARGERVLAFSHLSHIYRDGASMYLTFLFRRAQDPEETLERWRLLKAAASDVIVAHGGTISHQHGVGRDHAAYLPAEKGELGMALLKAMQHTLDPEGLLQPGNLLGDA